MLQCGLHEYLLFLRSALPSLQMKTTYFAVDLNTFCFKLLVQSLKQELQASPYESFPEWPEKVAKGLYTLRCRGTTRSLKTLSAKERFKEKNDSHISSNASVFASDLKALSTLTRTERKKH